MITNERARRAAEWAARDTYQHAVTEHWPACTACGTPIRRNVETSRPGLWRACACEDVIWQSTMDGWRKRVA